MTHFAQAADKRQYIMETGFPDDAREIVRGVHTVESITETEVVNRAIGFHALHAQIVDRGGLFIARTENKIEPIGPPEMPPEYVDCRVIRARIYPQHHDYLSTLSNPDDIYDLTGFWRSALKFYADLYERRILGADFVSLDKSLQSEPISLRSGIF